jgi:hypothetical protein
MAPFLVSMGVEVARDGNGSIGGRRMIEWEVSGGGT